MKRVLLTMMVCGGMLLSCVSAAAETVTVITGYVLIPLFGTNKHTPWNGVEIAYRDSALLQENLKARLADLNKGIDPYEATRRKCAVNIKTDYLGVPDGVLSALNRDSAGLLNDIPFGAKKVIVTSLATCNTSKSRHTYYSTPTVQAITVSFDDVSDDDLRLINYEEGILRVLSIKDDSTKESPTQAAAAPPKTEGTEQAAPTSSATSPGFFDSLLSLLPGQEKQQPAQPQSNTQ